MSRSLNSVALALAALGPLGCDSQVENDYQGEPLLRIQGSVVIPQEFQDQDLVPVLVFESISDHQLESKGGDTWGMLYDHEQILDVGVSGSFPSGFTLDVFDPPPPQAIRSFRGAHPPFALGYVAAVPPGHPAAVTRASYRLSAEDPTAYHLRTCAFDAAACVGCAFSPAGAACPEACGPFDPSFVRTHDPAICHVQELDCPSEAANWTESDCGFVSGAGNSDAEIAGYSTNIQVIYHPAPLPADSLFSLVYGHRGEPLAAGYYLYTLDYTPVAIGWPPTEPCPLASSEQARARYNAENGTNLTLDEMMVLEQSTAGYARYYEYMRLYHVARRDNGCPINNGVTPIDGAAGGISIDLGSRSPIALNL
jgi:hypothetical protein